MCPPGRLIYLSCTYLVISLWLVSISEGAIESVNRKFMSNSCSVRPPASSRYPLSVARSLPMGDAVLSWLWILRTRGQAKCTFTGFLPLGGYQPTPKAETRRVLIWYASSPPSDQRNMLLPRNPWQHWLEFRGWEKRWELLKLKMSDSGSLTLNLFNWVHGSQLRGLFTGEYWMLLHWPMGLAIEP